MGRKPIVEKKLSNAEKGNANKKEKIQQKKN